jgi:PAS domain S-box-containing protein
MNNRSRAGEPEAARDPGELLRLLLEQMPAIVWTTDNKLRFRSSSGGGLADLGLKPDELVGMSIFEYFRSEDPDLPPIAGHRRAFAGESVRYELEWADRTYRTHLEPLRADDGTIEGVVGVAFDVTELERAKEKLEDSLGLLRSTLDSTADGILVVDDSGRIVSYNRRFALMWQVPDSLVETGDAGKVLAFVLDQLDDPGTFVAKTMGVTARPDEKTFDLIRFKDGRIFERFSPASRASASAAPRNRVWSFRDITDRVRADEERSLSLSLLEATLESTADGVLVVDREGRIVRHNRKFVEMWRIPAGLVESSDDSRVLAFVLDQLKNPEGFLRKVKDLYDHPESQSFDWLEFKDGRVFERYSKPQMVGGSILGRVWSFRDVTDRARMEEMLRRQARTFEHMFDGVVVTDMSARITDCNPGAEKMFGHTREMLIGKTPEILMSPAEEKDKTSKILETVSRNGRWSGLLRFRRRDGVRGMSESVAVAHSDEWGRATAVIFIHRDVTAVKELEKRLTEEDTGLGRG